MTVNMEVQKLTFIPSGPRGEAMGLSRVAPLPVIFASDDTGMGYVGSASSIYSFRTHIERHALRYGRDNVTVPTPRDAEEVRELLLQAYLILGQIDPAQEHRKESHFADIAPSTISLIALDTFLSKDIPHLQSNKVVSKNIKVGQKSRVLKAYQSIMSDKRYGHYDSELHRTLSEVTV